MVKNILAVVAVLASSGSGCDSTNQVPLSDGGGDAALARDLSAVPPRDALTSDASPCPPTQAFCGAGCIDVKRDPNNCGACGAVCSVGRRCVDGACVCPTYQSFCNGACIPTSVDPKNCGGCAVVCPMGQVCSGGACAGSCLPSLTACNQICVDLATDNNNCGACGAACPQGTGCVDNKCQPALIVGPPPPKCVGGGPPITVGDGTTDTCTGNLAQTNFRWAICSCQDITLGGRLLTDAYDSTKGPYQPGGLGGGVGLNGAFSASSVDVVWGAMWASAKGGVSTSSTNTVKQELHVGGPLGSLGGFTVGDDGYVAGDVSTTSSIAIGKTLRVPQATTITGNVTYAALVRQPVTVPPPCDCAVKQLIPVAAIVAAAKAKNDNAAIGLNPMALATPLGNPVRLDLPCGIYYLTKIDNGPDPVTIVAHGHTALFVDGDVTAAPIAFTLDPTAEFDIFVTGVLKPWPGADVNLGSPSYPALCRLYSGGVAATNLTGGTIGGNLYAATSAVVASAPLEAYGAIYAGNFSNTSETSVHYDRQVLKAGDPCPTPTVDGGVLHCGSCKDCGNQACVNGDCGACATSADCCPPLICDKGTCALPIN